ncbi:MAG: hypothetical protein P0Y55_07850 [Candidatus Cohnella colombiensis]|uniref:Uncharacterized protein n=1 Tax=Candidatus Cohnella colombiensis TaxID=3121368 RepID=A0AA95EYQ4_9BACL|nr:MAG: hypothetical protein P0Y55_07850 [Cohnella sp.]
MKGIIGAILIYVTYIFAGLIMDTYPFKNYQDMSTDGSLNYFFIINSILFGLLYLSAKIINKYKGVSGILMFIAWYLLSTVYGILHMKKEFDLYHSDDWRGFFGWEFALWEVKVPVYIGVAQLIFIVGHFIIKIFLESWNSRNKSSNR